MEINAMPTRFKGVNFRSRLEAKWAHVFEMLQWDWSYEPFDLDGWIPDFLIRGGGKRDLLIDIKPIATYRMDRSPSDILDKLERAVSGSDQYHIAVLGVEPQGDQYAIGWLKSCEDWDIAVFCSSFDDYEGKRTLTDRVGLCQLEMSWHDVISGQHSKGCLYRASETQINDAFRESLNRVQWNRKAPRHIADVLGEFRL